MMNILWIFAFYLFYFLQLNTANIPIKLTDGTYIIKINNTIIIFSGVFFGSVFGILSNIYKKNYLKIKQKSYARIIISYSISHVSLQIFILFNIFIIKKIIHNGELNLNCFKDLFILIKNPISIKLLVYTFIVSDIIFFTKEINKKIGPDILLNMIMGKYRQPKEEKIIFLFIDLKSSTYYAEQLGHKKYSELLQDCFKDLTVSIKQSKAKIYQYVGDEVVLYWNFKEGLDNVNCIKSYFLFKETLLNKSDYYNKKYGFIPKFKAGLNGGKVMVAEVGIIKRSMAFHGDVVNTAARIQGECNTYSKDMLISEYITNKLEVNCTSTFMEIGSILLKGKSKKVKIFAVEKFCV